MVVYLKLVVNNVNVRRLVIENPVTAMQEPPTFNKVIIPFSFLLINFYIKSAHLCITKF